MLDEFVSLPLEKLVKAGWNYKEEDPEMTAKLAANILRNGQVENLIVRELKTGFYEVVNGNHRYDVLVALGFKEALCFNLGPVTLPQAQRIAIETNETRFASDDYRLSEIIRKVAAAFEEEDYKASMPFSDEEFDALLRLKPEEAAEYESSGGVDDDPQDDNYTSLKCPKCGRVVRVNDKGELAHE